MRRKRPRYKSSMKMDKGKILTYRQIVLLKLLNYSRSSKEVIFSKRTYDFTEEEWKYLNSLVKNNCCWFGGNTTRSITTERAKVHKSKLGLRQEFPLITHASTNHRIYKLHDKNIKKYLLATLLKKHKSEADKILLQIKQDYNINLIRG